MSSDYIIERFKKWGFHLHGYKPCKYYFQKGDINILYNSHYEKFYYYTYLDGEMHRVDRIWRDIKELNRECNLNELLK